jgi:hypothetical protein
MQHGTCVLGFACTDFDPDVNANRHQGLGFGHPI